MKIVTLNVHNIRNNYLCNTLVQIIKQHNVNIIFLQEISKKVLIELSKMLNMNSIWARAGYCGNGLLTTEKIISHETVEMKYISSEMRSAIVANISINNNVYKFVGTHLDHIHEKTRMAQLNVLDTHLNNAHFFCGDMNSICVKDYSSERLNEINSERISNNWPLVESNVIETIKYKYGFNILPYLGGTCRFNTRIDYIFHKNIKDLIIDQYIINTMDNGITDHNAVVCELNFEN